MSVLCHLLQEIDQKVISNNDPFVKSPLSTNLTWGDYFQSLEIGKP
jgi:hypothetical protein